jgi:hypothetical protein
MKETLELRINQDYASLLFSADEGKNLGASVKVVELSKYDPRYNQVQIIARQIQQKYNKAFFFGWEIKRRYNNKELEAATLLHMKIKTTFEPAGEECGTLYDETVACEICGAKRKQRSPLTLKNGSVPKKDIARTIAGEIVVSEKFAAAFKQKGMKGALLENVIFDKGPSNYYQLVASTEIELSQSTVAGINPFDLSTSNEGEIYKCPKGHTIGLNLLSEAYILNCLSIKENDFFASKQQVGIKRGLLRPEPLYLCSPAFREMVEVEKLTGFDFEIAYIQ